MRKRAKAEVEAAEKLEARPSGPHGTFRLPSPYKEV
jgi:hypothetical protein